MQREATGLVGGLVGIAGGAVGALGGAALGFVGGVVDGRPLEGMREGSKQGEEACQMATSAVAGGALGFIGGACEGRPLEGMQRGAKDAQRAPNATVFTTGAAAGAAAGSVAGPVGAAVGGLLGGLKASEVHTATSKNPDCAFDGVQARDIMKAGAAGALAAPLTAVQAVKNAHYVSNGKINRKWERNYHGWLGEDWTPPDIKSRMCANCCRLKKNQDDYLCRICVKPVGESFIQKALRKGMDFLNEPWKEGETFAKLAAQNFAKFLKELWTQRPDGFARLMAVLGAAALADKLGQPAHAQATAFLLDKACKMTKPNYHDDSD